ncbi:general L-amino acid transport system permease protein [Rhodobium orientis]|nr:amino acid ABC transporter permease [Rhodobium orientis]MBB4301647.1 general L-amino acid transport system permease protein [Rhodobium orientis]
MDRVPASFAVPKASDSRPPPHGRRGILARLHARYFASLWDTVVTLVIGLPLLLMAWFFLKWALVDAVWVAPEGKACQLASGACWAVVAEKYRVILFGTYPFEEQWRGFVTIALWIGWGIASGWRRVPLAARLWGWLVVAVVTVVLMRGGVFGLSLVSTDEWGGLPLTFLVFAGTVAGGVPLAVLLALGRRSDLPIISGLCVAVIEGVRGIPLLVVLFFAALILPLFLPPQLNIDKLLRAEIGMIIFFAAYAAEVIRGGLQAIPAGQEEAAKALGMPYWTRMRKIVLPQALSVALPALFNDIIRAFKNTTFFSILGLFDVLGATKAALQDPVWVRYGLEGYLFVFMVYLVFCLGLTFHGREMEKNAWRRLGRGEA